MHIGTTGVRGALEPVSRRGSVVCSAVWRGAALAIKSGSAPLLIRGCAELRDLTALLYCRLDLREREAKRDEKRCADESGYQRLPDRCLLHGCTFAWAAIPHD
jgi:hypothetical protein